MSISKKFVIIDEIMDQLEAAKSGVVPGSVSQSVVSGIQNVPTAIHQDDITGPGSGSNYTTFPLSPIVKNCCMDKTYLNFEFDVSFNIAVGTNPAAASHSLYIPFWFGLRDTASMFNQIQVLIENTAIWSTVYQREESLIAYDALPATEIRGNNQYASIEKMINNKYSPMKRIIAKMGYGVTDTNITQHFRATVDLNRLTPLLSNVHYTTPHMGNLRLKVFLQEFQKCLFFCPDYNYDCFIQPACDDSPDKAKVVEAITNATYTPKSNQYWSFYPFSLYSGSAIASATIPFYAYVSADAAPNKVTSINLIDTVTFSKHSGGESFMTFRDGIAEIVQTNFEIKSEEYERLTNYFASTGSVIIPTQTWSTSVFNNSGMSAGVWNDTMIGNVGGYNINFIAVFFHPANAPCCFNNQFLTNFQLILDGRPINAIPYKYQNDKCIVDMTQAIIDTDHEEINEDYISSLTFLNMVDDATYVKDADHANYHTWFGDGTAKSSICRNVLRNPNTCIYTFSTNLPDAFHSGACILENSNRQAVIRFVSNTALNTTTFPNTNKFPAFNSSLTSVTDACFSCFCDACIVLNFDASRNTCFDGQLSWASPYLD
jgi:hypothetical protein